MVAETDTGAPTASPSAASASARRGPSRGRLPIDLDRDVADLEARLADPPGGLGQQRDARRAGPPRVRRTEVAAEVAEAGGREQRVAGGVGRDVGVGVALEALRLVGPGQPGQVHRDAVDQAVDVGADADTHRKDGRDSGSDCTR